MKLRFLGVAALAAAGVFGLAAPASATCTFEPHLHPENLKEPVHFHVYCIPPAPAG